MALVTFEDFQKVEMRVGRIVAADDFPEARSPSYKLRIDFGPHGLRKSSAAVQPWYRASELVGRAVVAVTNFPLARLARSCPKSSASEPCSRTPRSSCSRPTPRGGPVLG